VSGVCFQWFTGTRRPGVFMRAFRSCLLLLWQIVPVRSSLCLFWISPLRLGSPGPNATNTNCPEQTLGPYLCFFVLDACSWSPAFLFRLFSGSVSFSDFRSLPLDFCGLFLFSSSCFAFGVCFTCTFGL